MEYSLPENYQQQYGRHTVEHLQKQWFSDPMGEVQYFVCFSSVPGTGDIKVLARYWFNPQMDHRNRKERIVS